jgi:hypothetical protein
METFTLTEAEVVLIRRALMLAIAQQSTLIESYQPLVIATANEKRAMHRNVKAFGALNRRLGQMLNHDQRLPDQATP